jgi:hypothetical protein
MSFSATAGKQPARAFCPENWHDRHKLSSLGKLRNRREAISFKFATQVTDRISGRSNVG